MFCFEPKIIFILSLPTSLASLPSPLSCSPSLSFSLSLPLSPPPPYFHPQVNELYSTMQRYSAENEKMVQQREKQIDTLKQQLEDTEKAKVYDIVQRVYRHHARCVYTCTCTFMSLCFTCHVAHMFTVTHLGGE